MKVNLKVEKDNAVETFQHEIKKANIQQITGALKVITDVVKKIDGDEGVENFISKAMEFAEREDVQDMEVFYVVAKIIPGIADTLLQDMPEKALELLATLSGIEYDVLVQQDPFDVMDIYDAVIEINDIERLIERGKKSLAATKRLSKIFKRQAAPQATQAVQQ